MQQDSDALRCKRALRPFSFLFFLIYAVQKSSNHFEGLSKFAVRRFLKEPEAEGGLGLTPERAGAFLGDTALGWYVKALFGPLTDNLPLFGYRRKSWLIIASLLAGLAWYWVALRGTTLQTLLVGLMMVNMLIAFSDVVCDGLMVETAQRFERRYGLPAGTANRPLQAAQWSGAMLAVFVTSVAGGVIAQFFDLKTAAVASGIGPLILAVAVAVIVKEDKVPWDWHRARKGLIAVALIVAVAYAILWLKDAAAGSAWKPFEPVLSALLIIGCLLAMVRIPRSLIPPLIFVLAWQAIPFDTNAQFVYQYFTRDNQAFVAALASGSALTHALEGVVVWLGMAQAGSVSGVPMVEMYWGSVVASINALFGVIGALYFRRYLMRVPFSRLIALCIAGQGVVIMCFLSFSILHVASPAWLMGLMAVEGFVFIIATLATVGYTAKCIPEDNQASIFALFMGLYNLGQVLGREHVGSRLYTSVASAASDAVGASSHAAMEAPDLGLTAVVLVALVHLSLVYLLVRHMARRGYIA